MSDLGKFKVEIGADIGELQTKVAQAGGTVDSFVKKVNVEDETFQIPSKYKIISRSEMDNLFKDFQN